MKIAIILYIIGIVVYWLGVFSVTSTTKRNWNDVDESLKADAKKLSKASCRLTLITWSLIPVLNFIMGFLCISNPVYFLEKK